MLEEEEEEADEKSRPLEQTHTLSTNTAFLEQKHWITELVVSSSALEKSRFNLNSELAMERDVVAVFGAPPSLLEEKDETFAEEPNGAEPLGALERASSSHKKNLHFSSLPRL